MKHNLLFDELRAAFPPVSIVAAGAFEQRGMFYCDAGEYRREMDGKTWEQLDPQFFARRSDGLSFLGTPYIVAVLPFYLHLLLVLRPNSPVPQTLLPQLTKPEPTDRASRMFDLYDELVKRFDELTRALTDRQRQVVGSTLQEFVRAAPRQGGPAQRALDRYWHAFVADDRRGSMSESAVKTCGDCESTYFAAASKMSGFCPECAHVFFDYPNCDHVFEAAGQRCARCGWDGSRSSYGRELVERVRE